MTYRYNYHMVCRKIYRTYNTGIQYVTYIKIFTHYHTSNNGTGKILKDVWYRSKDKKNVVILTKRAV
jgi:hypothetical protein